MFLPSVPNKVKGIPRGWKLLEYPHDTGCGLASPDDCALAVDDAGELRLLRVTTPWKDDRNGKKYFTDQPTYGLHMYDPTFEKALSAHLRKGNRLGLKVDFSDSKYMKHYKEWLTTIEKLQSMFPLRTKKEK